MKLTGLFNVVTTSHLRESVAFYTTIFGFDVIADIGWYVQLGHDSGAELAFMEPDHPSQPPLYQPAWTGRGLILSFEVEDAEQALQEIQAQGREIVFALKEEEWGQIHFGILDPNGIPVDVVQTTRREG